MPAALAIRAGVLEGAPASLLAALKDEHEAAAGDPLAAVAQAAAEAHARRPEERVRDARIVLEAGTRTEKPRATPRRPRRR